MPKMAEDKGQGYYGIAIKAFEPVDMLQTFGWLDFWARRIPRFLGGQF
jgi:hypothetical protein